MEHNNLLKSSYCGVYGLPYELYTDEVQNWIACDGCEVTFHFKCVGVITVPEVFFHSVSLKVNFINMVYELQVFCSLFSLYVCCCSCNCVCGLGGEVLE